MSEQRLSIWFLSSELADEAPGGIGRYIHSFTRLLASAGHRVTVIARSKTERDETPLPNLRLIGFKPRWDRLNEECDSPRPDDHPAFPYNVMGYAQAVSFEMADKVGELLGRLEPPDLVECQEFSALPYYLLHRKLTGQPALQRIPILVHLHGPLYELLAANQEPRYRLPDYWTGQMEKYCIRAADALLAPSRFLTERVVAAVAPDRPIPNIAYPSGGIDGSASAPARPGDIVYVGRLQWLKGVVPLVQSCADEWEAGRDFRLTMVGASTRFTPRNCAMDEYLRKRYARYIEDGRLRITGTLPYEEVQAHIRGAWAVVLPSLWENFPIVCIEAMSAGRVVLVSRSGGQAEMVSRQGEDGFVFDWNKPGDFAEQLGRVLDLAPEQRAQIGGRARERIREVCEPQGVLEKRIAHYRQVLAEYQPRRLYPRPHHAPAAHNVSPRLAPTPSSEEVPDLLSVVVPYYNMGAWVRETIGSIITSTYRPLEIVILDDGTTEPASLEALRELEGAGIPGLRVVRTSNQGLAGARNNGADAARGEFVCFLDADDCVEPHYFERCIEVLRRYPNVDFVYSWARYFGASDSIWPAWDAEFPYLLGHNMVTAFAVVRRQSFLRWGRNKPAVAYALEDFEMWISILEAGGIGVCLPEPLVRYRIRKDSMLQTSTEDQQLYLHDVISRLHPEPLRQWSVDLLNLLNANGPSRLWNHPASPCPACTPDGMSQLWAELQRLAKGWEEQNTFIKEQKDWIGRLEEERDSLWRELQRLNRGWEQQNTYIKDLERVKDRLWAESQELAQSWRTNDAYIKSLERQLGLRAQLHGAWRRVAGTGRRPSVDPDTSRANGDEGAA